MADAAPTNTAALVVAGGLGSRMGGIDKPGLELAGVPLRERALAAARDAGLNPIVHIGPETDGGPVAAIAAGIAKLVDANARNVIVLAGDLVRPEQVIAALTAAAREAADAGRDGIVLVDPHGRVQWLAAAYRIDALRSALAGLEDGPRDASVRALLRGLDLHRVLADTTVVADIDSWQDYQTAKGQVDG